MAHRTKPSIEPVSDAPAIGHYLVTPSDVAELPKVARSLRCRTVGTVSCKCLDGNNTSFTFYSQGEMFSAAVLQVYSTGTTAAVEAYV